MTWATRAELRFGGILVAALAGIGAVLGLVWSAISRTATVGEYLAPNALTVDESEGFIRSDVHFLFLTAPVGLVAGFVVWRFVAARGPVAVAALGVGGILGALLTDLVGGLVGGGTDKAAVGVLIPRLPLEVHARGLLLFEAALALFVYLIATLFAVRDDLGVAEPDHAELSAPLPGPVLPGYGIS